MNLSKTSVNQFDIINVMEAWLKRCRNDNVGSSRIAEFIVTYVLQGNYLLAVEFARKAAIALNKAHAHNKAKVESSLSTNSSLTFELALSRPPVLFNAFTKAIDLHINSVSRLIQFGIFELSFHPLVYELLQQIFRLYRDEASGKAGYYDACLLFKDYFLLEFFARGTSWLHPPTSAALSPGLYTQANAIVEEFFTKLKSFEESAEMTTTFK